MNLNNGTFVISLDFELHWGVIDTLSIDDYGDNLRSVGEVIDRLLKLCDDYSVKVTFSIVGMLFAKTKEQLLDANPKIKPTYTDSALDPYKIINNVGENEEKDNLHYANSIIKKIIKKDEHEIGTHTYCHYYCLAQGQTVEQFNADLTAAKRIASNLNVELKSIIFPRNQVNEEYLEVCYNQGIQSYRGTEQKFIYNTNHKNIKKYFTPLIRLTRLIDAYVNITGHNVYDVLKTNKFKNKMINLPSSRLLRPYSSSLKVFENLKVKRVKDSMMYAAKNNKMFHLWWHPHNFGADMDENFDNLEKIFIEYKRLNLKYKFESITMTDLTKKIINK